MEELEAVQAINQINNYELREINDRALADYLVTDET